MKAPFALAALLVLGTSTYAAAYDYPTEARKAQIDGRRAAELDRIQHARRTGDLTLTEKWRLKREQAHIAQLEREALRDGHISRQEQYVINRALNRANHNIYREANDGNVAWWRRW
jgi:CRISPR/Cas system-associated endoribonuclease Cas2